MQPEQIILEPIISEKAVGMRAESCYVFRIHPKANKLSVAQAVEALFKVNVKSVNTCQVRAKRRMRGAVVGRTRAWKKAYVMLKAGQKIEELTV